MVALRELLEECQIGNRDSPAPFSPELDQDYPTTVQDSARRQNNNAENSTSAAPFISSHRALVFCQWKSVIDLITGYIDRGEFGAEITYLRLDSSIPPSERQDIANRFNTDSSIDLLFLTTKVIRFLLFLY